MKPRMMILRKAGVTDEDGVLTPAGMKIAEQYAVKWVGGVRSLEMERAHPELTEAFYGIRIDDEVAHDYASMGEARKSMSLVIPLSLEKAAPLSGALGGQKQNHKYTERKWMADHWVYTYAKEHSGEVAGHEHDENKVVLKLPIAKLDKLKAFKVKHDLGGKIFEGSTWAFLAVTKEEAAKLANVKPVTLPPAMVIQEPVTTPPVVATEPAKKEPKAAKTAVAKGDGQRIGPMEEVKPEALDNPTPPSKNKGLQRGSSITAKIHGTSVKTKLSGFDVQGKPVVIMPDGERFVLSWDDVSADGTQPPFKPTTVGLPAGALIKATAQQAALVDKALAQGIFPGKPSATAFVKWLRGEGHETFLVGGLVRDLISGTTPGGDKSDDEILHSMKDVDILSTAPPTDGLAMFHEVANLSPDAPNLVRGSIKMSTAAGGLDFASVAQSNTFAPPATFDHDLKRDIERRDFSCNSVMYDPANHVIIDVDGHGIADAQHKVLRLCTTTESEEKNSLLVQRFWKMRVKGYTSEEKTLARIKELAPKHFADLGNDRVARRFGEVVAQKGGTVEEQFSKLRAMMKADGAEELFQKFIAPLKAKIIAAGKKERMKAGEM